MILYIKTFSYRFKKKMKRIKEISINRKNNLLIFIFVLCCLLRLTAQSDVTVSINEATRTAELSNGIITFRINGSGQGTYLNYEGQELIGYPWGGRFYFGYTASSYNELSPNSVRIVQQTAEIAEVVHSNTIGTLNIEQSYIIKKGVSGLYCYIVLKGTTSSVNLREMRVVYRLNPNLFNYGYVSDDVQGPMVEPAILNNAPSIMDATYELPDGSIYTKYDWANYVEDDYMHGLTTGSEGVWVISASDEYLNGGPMKQELMVHATNKTPLILKMLQGEHFGALAQDFSSGDEKLYGPFFIYVNSGKNNEDLITNAKTQVEIEKSLWPYSWMDHKLFPLERSTVKGYINLPADMPLEGIKVVLAQPDIPLYDQGKEYMFWGETNEYGGYKIPDVRYGTYTLYAYATQGEVTDKLIKNDIVVSENVTFLDTINWLANKYEHLIFKIGEANRKAKEFQIGDSARRYGLWELPPANLTFNVASDDYSQDWYYAQTKPGKWTVNFHLDSVYTGGAVLTTSLAGAAANPLVYVLVNGTPIYTYSPGNDASVYRSATQSGRHRLFIHTISGSLLKAGNNTIEFQLVNVDNRGGIMYDIIKLEAGELLTEFTPIIDPTNIDPKELLVTKNYNLRNYPNPFRDQSTIIFNLLDNEYVTLAIYTNMGQLIKVLCNEFRPSGLNTVALDGSLLNPGIYFYQLTTDAYKISQKCIVIE